MSVDVLWAVPDKVAAVREVARILRPGGRFLFTSWDFATPLKGDTQVSDHRPLLHEAGFIVDAYEETAAFDAYYQALAKHHEAARDDLIAEMGERLGNRFIGMTSRNAAIARRRVFVVATLPG
jgi:SAM-dependent methyltransferase